MINRESPPDVMNLSTANESGSIMSWANAIAQALEMQDISSRMLFEKAGIPYRSTVDPTYRIGARKITALFQLAVKATKDPSFGLKVASFVHPASFHALGYSLFASNNLHDFCQRIVRYFKLLSDNAQHHLLEDKDSYLFIHEIINPNVCFETTDGWFACIIQFCRYIYRPDFSPLRVEFIRPEPATHAENFGRYFKAPVVFSAKENVIYFDKKDMFVPLPAANAELARRNDEVVVEHLARLDHEDIVRQVEAQIVALLPTGECSKEKIAAQINMSSSNLQKKLKQKNTSYQEILDDLRSSLARQYIEQKSMSISEITYRLGFSDTSNFSRAFRRWTGYSPSSCRENKYND